MTTPLKEKYPLSARDLQKNRIIAVSTIDLKRLFDENSMLEGYKEAVISHGCLVDTDKKKIDMLRDAITKQEYIIEMLRRENNQLKRKEANKIMRQEA